MKSLGFLRKEIKTEIESFKYNLSWQLNYPIIYPEILTINITRRCNLNCLFCFDYNNKPLKSEMNFNEVQKILFNAKKIGTKNFNIMGGEPFIREDILQIIKFAQEMNFNTAVTTNGTLLNKEKIRQLVSYLHNGLFSIMISLDGAEASEHDFIRGDGNFKKSFNTIKYLDNERRKQKKDLNLGINCVVNSKTIMHLDKMITLAERLHVNFIQLVTMVPAPSSKKSIIENELYFKPKQFQLLDTQIDFFIRYKKSNGKVKIANDLKNLENFKSYYRRQYESIKKGW